MQRMWDVVKNHKIKQMKRKQAVYQKKIQSNDSKDDAEVENKMEAHINRLEAWIKKMQELFNKDVEE